MISPINPPRFADKARTVPVIDVRSPGEYTQGHITGAFNIPIYNDFERAVVGTLYVNAGKDHAILKGLDIALPRVDRYLDSLRKLIPPGPLLVHCWRGGLRSATMAQVFNKGGYEVELLVGGYKSYRQYIRTVLAIPRQVIILGGYTGSGKTTLLHALADHGEQIIDLERLASHKGSVFGAFGQAPQPTNEQFENDLFTLWHSLDPDHPVWVEDESRMIGNITLPEPVSAMIGSGLMIRVNVEKQVRICNLVNDYARFDKTLLSDAIKRISQRLGGDRARIALTALEMDDFYAIADITLTYYDKAYQFAIDHRKGNLVYELEIEGMDPSIDALKIIDFAKTIQKHESDIS